MSVYLADEDVARIVAVLREVPADHRPFVLELAAEEVGLSVEVREAHP